MEGFAAHDRRAQRVVNREILGFWPDLGRDPECRAEAVPSTPMDPGVYAGDRGSKPETVLNY